jgi:hypothetical protein
LVKVSGRHPIGPLARFGVNEKRFCVGLSARTVSLSTRFLYRAACAALGALRVRRLRDGVGEMRLAGASPWHTAILFEKRKRSGSAHVARRAPETVTWFSSVLAKGATAVPKHPERGYGYEAAHINYAFLAHVVLTTDQGSRRWSTVNRSARHQQSSPRSIRTSNSAQTKPSEHEISEQP